MTGILVVAWHLRWVLAFTVCLLALAWVLEPAFEAEEGH